MNMETSPRPESKRRYKQGARAEAAARTAEAIVDAFARFLEDGWYNDISLERVATEAGVTVQTVLRHFGTKEGMLEGVQQRVERDVLERRAVEPGDIDGAIRVVTQDYEASGDMVLRFLAQEDRVPALRKVTDLGRASHRNWVRAAFQPHLDGLDPDQADLRLDGLVTALDVYVWKIMRRDRGRSPEEVRRYMKTLVSAIVGPENRAA